MNPFDSSILLWLNQFAGRSEAVESLAQLLCNRDWLKGLAFAAVIGWLWAAGDTDRRANSHAVILATLASAIAAIFLGRALATLLPFRVRPVFNPALHLRPHPLTHVHLRNWSAFPSDHAMLFAALASGVCFISPGLGVGLFIYGLLAIDLPRLYLGLHHPTDVIAGAMLGTAVACLFNAPAVRTAVAGPGLRLLQARRCVFYAALACLSVQIMTMFAGPRAVVSAVVELSHR